VEHYFSLFSVSARITKDDTAENIINFGN